MKVWADGCLLPIPCSVLVLVLCYGSTSERDGALVPQFLSAVGVAVGVSAVGIPPILFAQLPDADKIVGVGGWIGAGLLGCVLYWLLFHHIPSWQKENAARELRMSKANADRELSMQQENADRELRMATRINSQQEDTIGLLKTCIDSNTKALTQSVHIGASCERVIEDAVGVVRENTEAFQETTKAIQHLDGRLTDLVKNKS